MHLWYHVESPRESSYWFSGQGTASSEEGDLPLRETLILLQDYGVD